MVNSKILEIFCDPNRGSWKEPFINGGNDYVVASDTHIMAFLKKECVESDSPLVKREKDYVRYIENDDRIPQQDITIKYDNIIKALKCLHLDENKEHDCSECDGNGTVDYEYRTNDGEYHVMEGDCPVCDGTGIDPNYVNLVLNCPPNLVNGWYNKQETSISIYYIDLAPQYIAKLAKLMYECGVSECKLYKGDHKHACCFQLTEDIRVAIMPLFQTDFLNNTVKIEYEENETD